MPSSSSAPSKATGNGGDGGPSTASLLGGAALVGAAAGYALIAMRFRNFGSNVRSGSGSAEFRAAQAFSKEWERSAAPKFEEAAGASGAQSAREEYEEWQRGRQERQQQRQKQQQQQQQQQRHPSGGSGLGGPPAWALRELGLRETDAPITLAEAKAAYRERAKSVHPDLTGGGKAGPGAADGEAFKRLTDALKAVEPHAVKR